MGMHNNGKHLEVIVGETVCAKHRADKGDGCWSIENETDTGRRGMAACGSRVKKYGYDGKISAQSMQTRREKQQNRTQPTPR